MAYRSHVTGGLFAPTLREVAIGAAFALGVACAAAAAEHAAQPVHFSIPSEPLLDALQAFSRATDMQVMFETRAVQSFRSDRLDGDFEPNAALRQLIAKTDLHVHYTRANVITLSPATAEMEAPPALAIGAPDMTLNVMQVMAEDEPTNLSAFDDYISDIQADIQAALKKAARVHQRDYKVGLNLWVSSSRGVERAEVFRSSGDTNDDVLIVSSVRGMRLSRDTPERIPQPISFLVEIRSF
jgi:hypothetical protein